MCMSKEFSKSCNHSVLWLYHRLNILLDSNIKFESISNFVTFVCLSVFAFFVPILLSWSWRVVSLSGYITHVRCRHETFSGRCMNVACSYCQWHFKFVSSGMVCLYVTNNIWFTSGFVSQASERPQYFARDLGLTLDLTSVKAIFPLITIKLGLKSLLVLF